MDRILFGIDWIHFGMDWILYGIELTLVQSRLPLPLGFSLLPQAVGLCTLTFTYIITSPPALTEVPCPLLV